MGELELAALQQAVDLVREVLNARADSQNKASPIAPSLHRSFSEREQQRLRGPPPLRRSMSSTKGFLASLATGFTDKDDTLVKSVSAHDEPLPPIIHARVPLLRLPVSCLPPLSPRILLA